MRQRHKDPPPVTSEPASKPPPMAGLVIALAVAAAVLWLARLPARLWRAVRAPWR